MMRKKVAISDVVLFSLEKAVDGYVRFEDFTTHAYRYHYGSPELKKSSLATALKRMREQGFIDLDRHNNQLIAKITNKGKNETILRKILNNEEWDGKWRIVFFDIPETHRKVRNVLRSKLKTWGFIPWQKSVWATKKDITEVLRQFVRDLKVERWVLIIESTNIGDVTS